MTLGDLCVKQGANKRHYRDAQSDMYVVHHNLAALCYAVASANRIFDSKSLVGTRNLETSLALTLRGLPDQSPRG